MLSAIETFLIQIVVKFLTAWIAASVKRLDKKSQIEAQAKKDKEALDAAKTPEEKAKAITDAAHDTFS